MRPLGDMVRPDRDPKIPARPRRLHRGDLIGASLGAVLVACAFLVPYLRHGSVTPVTNPSRWGYYDFADAAPLFGWRNAHVGWGTPIAIVIAILVVWWGPVVAQRLPWRRLLACTWLVAFAWSFALALVDGWQRGLTSKFTSPDEYLNDVDQFSSIPDALREFARRIPDYQPDSWTTHVSGHPPGAVLIFVWLDRIGLAGATMAAVVTVVLGTSAAAAVIVALRALGEEEMARRAAPFVALAPAAIWMAVSADALFTAVTAWGLALLALSASRSVRWPIAAAAGAGVLLGFGIYLSYGLVLLVIPAVAILLVTRTIRPLLAAVIGALAVAAAFTAYGFWWFDGYTMVKVRYYQGVAADRPFAYWAWANFASLTCAVGLAVAAAVHRVFARPRGALRPLNVVVMAFLIAVVVADLSALSKAETERIWLPFEIWILTAAALLPRGSHRFWLGVQAAVALAINHLILTNW